MKRNRKAIHIEVAPESRVGTPLKGDVKASLKVYGSGPQPGAIWVATHEYYRRLVGPGTAKHPTMHWTAFFPKKENYPVLRVSSTQAEKP